MNFQKRMTTAFAILILVVSTVFGGIYYRTIRENYIETERKNLQTAADNYAQQFCHSVSQMEEVIQNILSNQEVLNAVRVLSHINEKNEKNYYYTEAKTTIRTVLNADYYKKSFNRVVLFMQSGTVISSTNYQNHAVDLEKEIQDLMWMNRVEGQRGKYVLLGAHEDDWGTGSNAEVVSVVKEILGENFGYLEVQRSVEVLDEMFLPANTMWDLYVFQEDYPIYSSVRNGKDIEKGQILQKELLAVSQVQENEIRVMIVDHTPISKEAMKAALPLTLLLILVMGAVSSVYIYLMARHMVKPIHQLKRHMQNTNISNLNVSGNIEIADREMALLYETYEKVLVNLDESIRKERFFSELQQKAQFDLLQAQVNPHFLFNVLNVISSRGAEADDEVICDICADLAQMLRYSTDVKEKQAEVQEEIHYLEQYLTLLKYRYEDMLEYEIIIDERMSHLKIPKMVLQQIVENAITHGYQETDVVKEVSVRGELEKDSRMIRIKDNGTGISKEMIQKIYVECEAVKAALTQKRKHVEMAIGGMGLTNSYARLYQIYGEHFSLEIHRLEKGTEVVICIKSL